MAAGDLHQAVRPNHAIDRYEGFSLPDLRHAFATLTLKNGTSVNEVSQLLGHSSPVITLSTYAHVIEGVARQAVNVLATA